jgi:hypothetical protein
VVLPPAPPPPVTPPVTPPVDPPVTPPVDPPLDFVLSANGLSLIVNEAYLTGGTAGTNYGHISGFVPIVITSNDGIGSFTVQGVNYPVSGGTLAGFPVNGIPDSVGFW